ncbi:MAG TPA: PH domain-containing protein [Allosphingosinicella sp.]|jgi:putative membrane protein
MSATAPQPRRLHPATLLARALRIVPQMLGGGAAYAAVVVREGFGAVLVFAAVAGGLGLVVALLVWLRFRYTVRENEILIESGVLKRQRRVIAFERVQDIAIEQQLLARLFGTARVRIETGGSAADEGDLDMIALADAHALRDRIRRGATAPGSARAEEPVLFAMGVGRLLYSGLFNFSVLFLAAIFAALQYLDEFKLIDVREWVRVGAAGTAVGYLNLQVTLMLIGLLLLLGIVAGVARTVARDFGFRLTRAEAGLRRRRGLFTLSEVVIPIRRTQVTRIESGPVARMLGWHRLSFQTLGADRKQGGLEVAAPFARMEELLPILAEAGFAAPPPRAEYNRLPRRALIRRSGPLLALAAPASAAAVALEPRLGLGAAVLLMLALLASLKWRRHGYALGGEALFVASGLLRRRTWTIPYGRTQTIHVAAGPLQRRLRLATLLVDTAGAPTLTAPEVVDLDSAQAESLADGLLARFEEARSRTVA